MKDNIDSILNLLIKLTKDFKLKWVFDGIHRFYVKTDNYVYALINSETSSDTANIEMRIYDNYGKKTRLVSSIYEKIDELNGVVYDFVHNGKERYDLVRLTNKIVHEDYSSTKKCLYTKVESEAFIKELTEHLYENYSEYGWECDDGICMSFSCVLNGCILVLESKSDIVTLTVLDDYGTVERRGDCYPIIGVLYDKVSLLKRNEIDIHDIICDLSDLDKKDTTI